MLHYHVCIPPNGPHIVPGVTRFSSSKYISTFMFCGFRGFLVQPMMPYRVPTPPLSIHGMVNKPRRFRISRIVDILGFDFH